VFIKNSPMTHRIKKLSLKNKALNAIHPAHWHRGRIQRLEIHSRHLHNHRHVDIYLPPGYDHTPGRHYPVLYMHDGNNLFYKHLAFGHHPWHADQMLDRLINHGLIEPIILVGVFNTPGRVYEYTWTPMPKRRGHTEGGGGHFYAHFLVDELKPRIDREFRTLTGPEHTGTMGSSLGGLISWYLGLYFPFVFQKVGLISPSLWWGRGHALTEMHKLSTDMQIWLDTGTREGSSRAVEMLKRKLHHKGYQDGHNLGFLLDRGGRHHEYSWGQRLHLPLLFFYGRKELLRVRA